jgi:hypothetical protein
MSKIITWLTWAKGKWMDFTSLGRMTHSNFTLTANKQVDYQISSFAKAAGWVVTIITGLGTFYIVDQWLGIYGTPQIASWIVSALIAGFMWWLTDRTLGNLIEKVVHDATCVLWWSLSKAYRTGKPKKTAPQKLVYFFVWCLFASLVVGAYMIDQKAVKVIQAPVAETFVKDTTRNLQVETAAVQGLTQGEIDRLSKQIPALQARIDNAFFAVLNSPRNSHFKRDYKKAKGWVAQKLEPQVKALKADLKAQKAILEARYNALTDNQTKAVAAITDEVTSFNERESGRAEAQTGLIVGLVFALGFWAKVLYGVAVAIRVLWYMAETNGGADVNGDGQVTQADIGAYYNNPQTSQQQNFQTRN